MQPKKENTKRDIAGDKAGATATAVKASSCSSNAKCSTAQLDSKETAKAKPACSSVDTARSKNCTAKVTIKYDVGFGNTLFIRGHGANLSWDKGIQLKNVKQNEWEWETTATFTKCEFKILINDTHYETGPDHVLTFGSSVQYTPHFSHY